MWLDAETGLYATLARLYDALTGRWLQRDPYQTALMLANALRSNAQTANIFVNLRAGGQYKDGGSLYGFARQNPFMYNDPDGQFVIAPWAAGIIVGAVAGAVGGAIGEVLSAWREDREVDWGKVGWGAVRGGVAGGAAGGAAVAAVAWSGFSGIAALVLGGTVEGGVDAGIQGYAQGERGLTLAADVVGSAVLSGVTAGFLGRIFDWFRPAAARTQTRFIDGVRVVDNRTGRVFEGTVDLKPTLDRIKTGGTYPHANDGGVFKNRDNVLPLQPEGYYREFVHPTPGIDGPGPQRIVVGQGGETYYTPDHYMTFVPVNP